MFQKTSKKLVALVVPMGLAVNFSLAPINADAATYLTDRYAAAVESRFDECWQARGGSSIPLCDGVEPEEVPEPEKEEITPIPIPKTVVNTDSVMDMGIDMDHDVDSDGDGVIDSDDRCSNTPEGVQVTAFGCPKDKDGDGVADYMDECPNTPLGAEINADGCRLIVNITINTTTDHFDFDSFTLKPAMQTELDEIAAKINASTGSESLAIIGHTDSTGPAAYNQILSEKRAKSVADYLSDQGVENLSVSGSGEKSPIATNATHKGRALNRRVEINTQ
jgi:OOP family OmpA-OmpF porin